MGTVRTEERTMTTKAEAQYILKLYITGETQASLRAVENLKRILKDDLHALYQLQIVDLKDHPQLAEDEKILATPTLARVLPEPIRRIIGDLSDKQRVLIGLDLITQQGSTS
jgi:circadian clock protein KaiB